MSRVIALLLTALFAPTSYCSLSNYYGAVVDVYDGDTIFVDLEGLPDIFGKRIGVRLAGIDTAEIRGKCSAEKKLAIEAREVLRELVEGKLVELKNVTRGKYFRLVADVYADDVSVSSVLLARELAVVYTGKGSKFDWCN